MRKFHVCYPGHDCEQHPARTVVAEVGTRIVFAIGQFTQSPVEKITVAFV